jgi:hypothetical protein
MTIVLGALALTFDYCKHTRYISRTTAEI